MVTSVLVEGLRRVARRVISVKPHLLSVGVQPALDVFGEVMSAVYNHPNLIGMQPSDPFSRGFDRESMSSSPYARADASVGPAPADL